MKYGSVYTPKNLADFLASSLSQFLIKDGTTSFGTCLDPACGGFSLLEAVYRSNMEFRNLIGVDFDLEAIELSSRSARRLGIDARIINQDFLLPSNEIPSASYWIQRIGKVDTIVANPPWSSNRIYMKKELVRHGFTLASGQYDSYFLFIELALSMLKDNGYAAFILPDSLFAGTAKSLRKRLLYNFEIKMLARLGEKLFDGVFRATTVLIVKNSRPKSESMVSCFRLSPAARTAVLENQALLFDVYCSKQHLIPQSHFKNSNDYLFDIDTSVHDAAILTKIRECSTGDWTKGLSFARGVEISRTGTVYICPKCGLANCVPASKVIARHKCRHCGAVSSVAPDNIVALISTDHKKNSAPIFIGASVGRYGLSNPRHIVLGIEGVNYKKPSIYKNPKLLIRKTGLGIKSAIDLDGGYTTQSVYFFYNLNQDSHDIDRLSYYMALLNSRTIFYYYMKCYGENEWKSHPYLTKRVLENLPLIQYNPAITTHSSIARCAQALMDSYNLSLDLHVEKMIQELYGLNSKEIDHLTTELQNLPDLQALKEMKI